MDIINALKRLQRAGDDNSKATKKLHAAVREVAQLMAIVFWRWKNELTMVSR